MTDSGTGGDSGGTGGGGWTAPAAPPPAAAVPGAAGMVYADVPNRAIAYIIDAIILFVVNLVLFGILLGLGIGILVVYAVIGLVISAAYFIYTWTAMRATIGMKVLGMQIGNAADGKTLTMDQAVRRWAVIAVPAVIAQAFQGMSGIGTLLSVVALGWFIYLLYTTYKSPTKQGFHDMFVGSAVVKSARGA